jgi:hypothetical protein
VAPGIDALVEHRVDRSCPHPIDAQWISGCLLDQLDRSTPRLDVSERESLRPKHLIHCKQWGMGRIIAYRDAEGEFAFAHLGEAREIRSFGQRKSHQIE